MTLTFTPRGFAEGIDLTRTSTVHITSNSQLSQLIAAWQTPNTEIIVANGLYFAIPSAILPAARTSCYVEDGVSVIDGLNISSGPMLNFNNPSCFIGNLDIRPSTGQAAANNPGGGIRFQGPNADLFYVLGCTITMKDDPAYQDSPENDEMWNWWTTLSPANSPKRFTYDRVKGIKVVNRGKFMLMGGNADASLLRGTLVETVTYGKSRAPLMGDNSSADIVNCVAPNNYNREEWAVARSGGKLNVRGCMIGMTSDPTPSHAKQITNAGGGLIYAPTSGHGNDNNLAVAGTVGTPTWDTTSSTPVFTPPYILTPKPATLALMAQVEAMVGAGKTVLGGAGSGPPIETGGANTSNVRAMSRVIRGIGR